MDTPSPYALATPNTPCFPAVIDALNSFETLDLLPDTPGGDVQSLFTLARAATPRRQDIPLEGIDDSTVIWQAPSMPELWRGEDSPSPDSFNKGPPPLYVNQFYFIERNLMRVATGFGGWRDAEFKEAFSVSRRRPQGKSMGPCHDAVWRTMALACGIWPISQVLYTIILQRLERSARTFQTSISSRNYYENVAEGVGLRL
jgi:hypothetical protein